MIKLNVQDAKTHLSRYLAQVERGEIVVLCRHNTPIAEIRALPKAGGKKSRTIGLCKGQFTVGPEFFEPLPDEMLELFREEG